MREGLRPFRNCSRKIQFITAGPVHGYKDFEKFHADFLTVFPDLRVEQGDVITEGDKLAARFTVTGTQTGPLRDQPPTGKKVKFTGSGICAVRDGKCVEVWNEVDFLKMQYDLSPDTPDVE
jgi:predicted ester cyclase